MLAGAAGCKLNHVLVCPEEFNFTFPSAAAFAPTRGGAPGTALSRGEPRPQAGVCRSRCPWITPCASRDARPVAAAHTQR